MMKKKSYLFVSMIGTLLLLSFLIYAIREWAIDKPVSTAQVETLPPVSEAEPAPENWKLIWSDEFNYIGDPDPANWRSDVGGDGWGNGELQYYTSDGNAKVTGETLEIELRAEPMGSNAYTSARLVSTRGWLYGRFEISARLPKGIGTWPAIWMLPTDFPDPENPWPKSGELDIMEHVGYDYGTIHQTIHTGAFNHMYGNQKGGTFTLADVSDSFHLYAMEWLPDGLSFYIDNEEVFRYHPADFTENVTAEEWPFGEKPFSLLLNIAYGGSWGGAMGIDDAALPAVMEIDYVRVYERAIS
jgi:beta-glucanase (GH16 family)